jgi:hypothetical protein
MRLLYYDTTQAQACQYIRFVSKVIKNISLDEKKSNIFSIQGEFREVFAIQGGLLQFRETPGQTGRVDRYGGPSMKQNAKSLCLTKEPHHRRITISLDTPPHVLTPQSILELHNSLTSNSEATYRRLWVVQTKL